MEINASFFKQYITNWEKYDLRPAESLTRSSAFTSKALKHKLENYLMGVKLLFDFFDKRGDGWLCLQAVLRGEQPGQDLLQGTLVAFQLI